jgi:glutathione S-transferase
VSLPPATFRPPASATQAQKREHEQQMRAWLAHRLDRQNMQATQAASTTTSAEFGMALAQAGDVTMLRGEHPHLAKFIHAPPLGRGQRYPKQPYKTLSMSELAADFAKRIRALWREQYGEKRCLRGEKTSDKFAIDILREWYEGSAECATLTVSAVLAAAKPSGRHRPGPKAK